MNERVVEAAPGLMIEEAGTGFRGAVQGVQGRLMRVEEFGGAERLFPLGPGFLLEGQPIVMVAPSGDGVTSIERRADRFFVDGPEIGGLVEKLWGANLRLRGIHIEILESLASFDLVVKRLRPGPELRVAVLIDRHPVRSREAEIAEWLALGPDHEHIALAAVPFWDIWESVSPRRLGLLSWPSVAHGPDWRRDVLAAVGWPNSPADVAAAWERILDSVHTVADLEPRLLDRVEQLIDFVTEPIEARR
jgi:hypothetical protein